MSLPTPYTVQHQAHIAGEFDSRGNPVDTWAAPAPVKVHGWAPPSADAEPGDPHRSAVVRDLDVYAPAGTGVAPKDRMTVGGLLYEVVGHAEDYTTGPWQWAAGVRINLVRIEG